MGGSRVEDVGKECVVGSGQGGFFNRNNAPLQGHLMDDVSHYPAMQVEIPIKLLGVDHSCRPVRTELDQAMGQLIRALDRVASQGKRKHSIEKGLGVGLWLHGADRSSQFTGSSRTTLRTRPSCG